MIIFGYSYNKDELLNTKVPVTFLDFSEYKKIDSNDFVVIFGTSFTGSDTFSFDAMSDICARAGSIVYISSSAVYPFSLFKHKESISLITPRSCDGAVDLALEEFVLDIGIDFGKNTTILRVDILEDIGLLDIINKRSMRGIHGSIFSRISIISMSGLLRVLSKIEKTPEKFSQKTYNIASRSLSEYSYYSSIAFGKVYPSFHIKNTSLNTNKAELEGLL
jgi:hypothetical protein